MAHPKHQAVRQRYAFCCGYCGVSETDAGGELTVDHYHPVSAGGDDSDDNLVYACWRCNLYKSDFWPDAAQTTNGLRLLHPLNDDVSLHIRENERGVLEAIIPTGRVHLTILFLNRPQLVMSRVRRQEAQRQAAHYQAVLQINSTQAQSLNQLILYLGLLQSQYSNQEEDQTPDI